jgi:two-component system, chemotaxis family, response regulator Rcp1
MEKLRQLEILLVEDSPSDVFLTREALKESGEPTRLHVANDGIEALAFLRREDPHGGAPRPDLLLLDLNMPRKDGRELLAEMKRDLRLKTIPVIVLTSSSARADVSRAYQLRANCYLAKPIDFGEFKELIVLLVRFWRRVTPPPLENETPAPSTAQRGVAPPDGKTL